MICGRWFTRLSGPLRGDVLGDLLEKVAGVEGGLGRGLDEADDAGGVGGDEERKVGRGELLEGCGRDDEGGGVVEEVGCGLGFDDLGFVGSVGVMVVGCWVDWGSYRWRILGQERLNVDILARETGEGG